MKLLITASPTKLFSIQLSSADNIPHSIHALSVIITIIILSFLALIALKQKQIIMGFQVEV